MALPLRKQTDGDKGEASTGHPPTCKAPTVCRTCAEFKGESINDDHSSDLSSRAGCVPECENHPTATPRVGIRDRPRARPSTVSLIHRLPQSGGI